MTKDSPFTTPARGPEPTESGEQFDYQRYIEQSQAASPDLDPATRTSGAAPDRVEPTLLDRSAAAAEQVGVPEDEDA